MLSAALAKTAAHRADLSPGQPIEKRKRCASMPNVAHLRRHLDIWHSDVQYRKASAINFKMSSNGRTLATAIGRCGHAATWLSWPRSRLGQPRQSRLSHDEQRTLMTLCPFSFTLMIGGELPKADAWIVSLLTNRKSSRWISILPKVIR